MDYGSGLSYPDWAQQNLKTFIFNLGKTYIIILVALGVSSTSEFSLRTLTEVTTDGVASLMVGENDVGECIMKSTSSLLGCKIDKSLTVAQASMAFINQIDTAENPNLAAQVERAKLFAGAGAAGPGIVTGTMLIIYRVAMALFVGFAPFFILCLMFKKTTPYFSKWLNYGLATMFSSALLAAMASISTDLVKIIAESQYKYSKIASVTSIITGESVTGIFNSAMNQLGLGLMLSTVLIVVPPMAGNWFNGMMSGYFAANYFNAWNNPGGQNTVGTGQNTGQHGTTVQQSASYQNNMPQSGSLLQTTGHRYMHSNQPSASAAPSVPTIFGSAKQPQQPNPSNDEEKK